MLFLNPFQFSRRICCTVIITTVLLSPDAIVVSIRGAPSIYLLAHNYMTVPTPDLMSAFSITNSTTKLAVQCPLYFKNYLRKLWLIVLVNL